MNPISKSEISNYFTAFLNELNPDNINTNTLFIKAFLNNIVIFILIVAITFTSLGFIVILFVDLYKGFTLGYTFVFLLELSGENGLALACISILPQNIIYLIGFLIISSTGLRIALDKAKERFFGYKENYRENKNDIVTSSIIAIVFIILGVLVETYLSPELIQMIVNK